MRAMRDASGRRFPADGGCQHALDRGSVDRAARAFRDSNLDWLEEPTIPDDIAGHARIVREGGVPIATGENLHTLHEFTPDDRAGGVTFPEPDVTNCGGITVFMKVAHLAEAFNLPLTSHGAHDLTVHLLAAVPNRSTWRCMVFRWTTMSLRSCDWRTAALSRPNGRGTASTSIGNG